MTKAYAPNPFEGLATKEKNAIEFKFNQVVEKVVVNIVAHKSSRNLLQEVYMAGLYHGTLAARGWEDPQVAKTNGGDP